MTDPILERIRTADPERLATAITEADTEAALEGLLASIAPRRRRARVPRVVAVAAAAGLVSLAIIDPGSHGGRGHQRLTLTEVRTILRGAAAGLAVPAGAVLHVGDAAVQTFPNGRSEHWTDEEWQDTSAPYDLRFILRQEGSPVQEWAVDQGRQILYDPATNTIYTNPSPPPYTVKPGTTPGTLRLTSLRGTVTIDDAQLQALRDGQDTIVASTNLTPVVEPYSAVESPPFDVRSEALSLVSSGRAQVQTGVTFAGRPAIAISNPDGTQVYYVTPGSYQPLGEVEHVRGFGAVTDASAGTVTDRFTTYETLPGTVANRRLVTLEGAHPAATIDSSAADYNAAANRIFK